jgi:transcriptional regulator with PAS, ATPase and Fis domain
MGEGTVETRDTSSDRGSADGRPEPGALLVYTTHRPTCVPLRLQPGARIALGREGFGGALDDARASRQHAFVTRRPSGGFLVEDNGSRNGTFVGGVRLTEPSAATNAAIVRIGQSLILLLDDVRRFELPAPFEHENAIVGPTLARAHELIARAAAAGEAVLFHGETGSGKELAARVFHGAAARPGPLVAVNCAAIPTGVAERLLFGAKRGAYSGADADAEGYLQAADRGTLFLDEIAELDLLVQAKLLRAIETQEVIAVGATRPRKVDVRVCSATHQDLRGEIANGRFRQDLYFRIGRPEVAIPPLRERAEEIPWLVRRELAGSGELVAHAGFVEACLLRPWPGNVRELLVEVRRAGHEARARGEQEVRAGDLGHDAGRELGAKAERPLIVRKNRDSADEDAERIRRVLEENGGNVTAAARVLGMHRNQLRRWVERQKSIKGSGPDEP